MEWEPSINVGNWLVLSVVIMPTTSLAGLSMDLEILILRVEGMISRRSGRRRRREGRSFVLVLHYIRNVLMNMRRMPNITVITRSVSIRLNGRCSV